MLIVALAIRGKEYLYKSNTAHKVSKRSSKIILNTLNKYNPEFKHGYIWHLYEIDEYDVVPYTAALHQRFIKYKHYIKEKITY